MKRYIIYYIHHLRIFKHMLLLLVCSLCACESFVETDLPNNQITAETVYADENTTSSALLNVYAKLREGGILTGNDVGVGNLMAHYTDELDLYQTSRANLLLFYENNLLPETPFIEQLWEYTYNQIYALNDILNYTADNAQLDANYVQQIQGEAYLLRALLHFHLQQLFGEIPYTTTTNYVDNIKIQKLSEEQVYEKLIADLLQAQELLPELYPASDRVRPNKAVAQALLSRVYLYAGAWDKAVTTATQLIENPIYDVEIPLNQVFLKDSPAAIFQLSPDSDGLNTYEAAEYIFESLPAPKTALTQRLINSFETEDQRLQQWIGKVEEDEAIGYYPFKYKEKRSTDSTLEYTVVLRIAEQYLIRAEAYAHMGQLSLAASDLNTIRTRAALPDIEASTPEQMLAAILSERRHEFFTEYGHRFYDLKRFNAADEALNYKSGWEPYKVRLPLPESELVLNPNLQPQNTGY